MLSITQKTKKATNFGCFFGLQPNWAAIDILICAISLILIENISPRLTNANIQIVKWCLPIERWRDFPTESPAIGRGYGFPFNVADLSVSEGYWRKECQRAYGNAIVPQVMYEIFKAIEEVTIANPA